MATFDFIHLDPRGGVDQLDADEWERVLGFEVTVKAIAAACGAGNVDGQHGADLRALNYGAFWQRGTEIARWDGLAAVAIAARSSLPLPPGGATLATVKPDVDAVSAMAVVVLRNIGLWPDKEREQARHAEVQARVDLIAKGDSFVPGSAWSPRPLPTLADPWPDGAAPVEETRALAPLAAICSPLRGQEASPLPMRVAVVACWLLWGDPSSFDPAGDPAWDVVDASRIADACGLQQGPRDPICEMWVAYVDAADAAAQARLALARALATGCTKVHVALLGPADGGPSSHAGETAVSLVDHRDHCPPEGQRAKIAVVYCQSGGELGVGYCVAPVVVAMGAPVRKDAPGRKYTVAAWSARHVDFPALVAALDEAEVAARCAAAPGRPIDAVAADVRRDGWGGNMASGIVGSPQVDGSALRLDDLVRIVFWKLTA